MSFKIAVIGCGWISMAKHGPVYAKYAREHNDVELVGCCDRDPLRAEQFRAQYGFRSSYGNYLEMLDAEKPTVVCLNVPEIATSEIGCEVMRRGYPLLSEKPPGLSTAEIDRLIDTAKASGVIHQVAFNRRFTPILKELKSRLAGVAIHHIDHHFFRVGRTLTDFTTTAVHAVDTIRFLAGCDYERVAFRYQEFPEYGATTGVANYFLDCSFTSGVSAALSLCPVTGMVVEQTVIHSAESSFVLKMNLGPDAPGSLQQFEKGQLVLDLNAAQFSGSSDDFVLSGFEDEDIYFFEAVRRQAQPEHDFASSRQSIEIMQAMRERMPEYNKLTREKKI